MKQKKALLINEGFSDNIGDQAISNGVKLLLESKNFSVKTAGFSTNNQCLFNLKKSSNNKLVTMLRAKIFLKSIYWLFKNIIRILKCSSQKYNVAVIGGGQLIMEKSNFAIAMFTWVVVLKFFNK
jgi:polysaccharide pyruvyl transferase WcaK-like protein